MKWPSSARRQCVAGVVVVAVPSVVEATAAVWRWFVVGSRNRQVDPARQTQIATWRVCVCVRARVFCVALCLTGHDVKCESVYAVAHSLRGTTHADYDDDDDADAQLRMAGECVVVDACVFVAANMCRYGRMRSVCACKLVSASIWCSSIGTIGCLMLCVRVFSTNVSVTHTHGKRNGFNLIIFHRKSKTYSFGNAVSVTSAYRGLSPLSREDRYLRLR